VPKNKIALVIGGSGFIGSAIVKALQKNSIAPEFTLLDYMTDGQATTCVEGANGLEVDKPVTIAACDNGMIYDTNLFQSLMDSDDVKIITPCGVFSPIHPLSVLND